MNLSFRMNNDSVNQDESYVNLRCVILMTSRLGANRSGASILILQQILEDEKRSREAWENDEATRRGIPRRDSHREKIKYCHRAVFQARYKYHFFTIINFLLTAI